MTPNASQPEDIDPNIALALRALLEGVAPAQYRGLLFREAATILKDERLVTAMGIETAVAFACTCAAASPNLASVMRRSGYSGGGVERSYRSSAVPQSRPPARGIRRPMLNGNR